MNKEFAELGSMLMAAQMRLQLLSHAVESLLRLLPETQRQQWIADFSASATDRSQDVAPLANSLVDEQMAGQVAALLEAAGRPPKT